MTPLITTWIKVLTHLSLAYLFLSTAYSALWLLFQGKIGHRLLLWLRVMVYVGLGATQLVFSWNFYYHGLNRAFLLQALIAPLAVGYSIYAYSQRFNLCKTFRVSEEKSIAKKIEEKDRKDEKTMAYTFQMEATSNLLDESRRLRSQQSAIQQGG